MGTEIALLIEQKKPINLPYSSAENPKKKKHVSQRRLPVTTS